MSKIITRAVTPEYADGWERVFGKQGQPSEPVGNTEQFIVLSQKEGNEFVDKLRKEAQEAGINGPK